MISLFPTASLFGGRKVLCAALLLILVTLTLNSSANSQVRATKPQRTVVYGRVVYRDNQQPIRRIEVVLRSLTSLGPEELAATSNVRGEFRIEGVPAGRYFIGVKQTYETVGRSFWPDSMGTPRVQTDELGRWRFKEVPDGRYILFVEPNRAYGDVPENRRFVPKQQEVEVSGSDVNTVIDVGDGAMISGTIIVDGGPTPGGIYLSLTNESESGSVEADDIVDGNRFTIRNVPRGRMYLKVNFADVQPRYYLKSLTWKGKDLLNELLEIGEDTKTEGVQIVLSPRVATFTIRVRTPQGKPVPEAVVLLVPSNPNPWSRQEAQLFGETDANGESRIFGAPVEYLVFILPSGVQAHTLHPNEIQERSATAQRVSLGEGERRTFDVVVPQP